MTVTTRIVRHSDLSRWENFYQWLTGRVRWEDLHSDGRSWRWWGK